MMAEACFRLGIRLATLDPGIKCLGSHYHHSFICSMILTGGSTSPAGQIAELSIEGDFNDDGKIR